MKHSRADVRGKARPVLDIRFEPQSLTSYSGLIVFQHFFSLIGIKERLWRCFRHLKDNPIYGHHMIMMLLVVHLIIGHRRLRDVDSYRDDEMVKRVLGLKRLPDVSHGQPARSPMRMSKVSPKCEVSRDVWPRSAWCTRGVRG